MPESKGRAKPAYTPPRTAQANANKPNPRWFVPVMLGLMLIGLIWVVTYYISGVKEYPLPADAVIVSGTRQFGPDVLRAACEASLRRLGTDYIDLYQVHRPRPEVDIDETLGALTDLVRAGKVRYIGSSTFPASQIVEAQWVAERRGRERFVTEQPPYSILVRGIENDVLPTCQRHGMGVIPWSPLAGGWLTGRYRKGQDVPTSHRAQRIPQRYDMSLPGNQAKLEAADALAKLAEEAGLSLIDMALAFVLEHPAVSAAIIGPRTMEQLESQLGAADVDRVARRVVDPRDRHHVRRAIRAHRRDPSELPPAGQVAQHQRPGPTLRSQRPIQPRFGQRELGVGAETPVALLRRRHQRGRKPLIRSAIVTAYGTSQLDQASNIRS